MNEETIYKWARSCIWAIMACASLVGMFNLYLYPLLEIATLHYHPRSVACGEEWCAVESPCIINGSVLGSDFNNVIENYGLTLGAIVCAFQFLMMMRIFTTQPLTSTCSFFVFFILPTRSALLLLQAIEFKYVGGEQYTLLINRPGNYQCEMFSGNIDAVTLMHGRFYLLIADFVCIHAMAVTVPLYFMDEQPARKFRR